MVPVPPRPDVERLDEARTTSERFRVTGCVLHLLAREGIVRSKLAADVERAVAVPTTARS
jgi:hypothetical protein